MKLLENTSLPRISRQATSIDTMDWLSRHDDYQKWDDGSEPNTRVLVIRGGHNAGKTELIVEAVQLSKAASRDTELCVATISMRCSRDAKDNNRETSATILEQIFCSLLYRLLEMDDERQWLPDDDWVSASQNPGHAFPWTLPELRDEIVTVLKSKFCDSQPKIRVFMDDVNKCFDEGQADELYDLLSQITCTAGVDLKVCVTVHNSYTLAAFEFYPTIMVEHHNQSTIEAFVKRRLSSIGSAWLRDQAEKIILPHRPSEFAWPDQVIRRISAESGRRSMNVEEIISQIPEVFMATYDKLFAIEEFSHPAAPGRLMFQLLSGAKRPLSLHELRQAMPIALQCVANKSENSDSGLREGIFSGSYVAYVSRGFIDVRSDEKVQFRHPCMQKYLNLQSSWAPGCHKLYYEACVRALQDDDLHESQDAVDGDHKQTFGFLNYARDYWSLHARACGDLLDEVEYFPPFLCDCKKTITSRIFKTKVKRLYMHEIGGSHLLHLEKEDGRSEDPLVVLAVTGCTNILRKHLKYCKSCRKDCLGEQIRYTTHLYFFALLCLAGFLMLRFLPKALDGAVRSGMVANAPAHLIRIYKTHDYNEALDILVAVYLAVYVTYSNYQTRYSRRQGSYLRALDSAIKSKQAETAAWLVQMYRARDATLALNGVTMLYLAAYWGQDAVVDCLLKKGANPVQRSEKRYEFPLHATIVKGNANMVTRLMKKKAAAQMKARRKDGSTAFHVAVRSIQPEDRKQDVFKALVDSMPENFDIRTTYDPGRSPRTLANTLRKSPDANRVSARMWEEIRDLFPKDRASESSTG